MTKKQHLRIDSHVVVQLGAELISDSEQALLELVKNAYDADASKCVISLEPEWEPSAKDEWHQHLSAWQAAHKKPNIGRLVVMDDGTGVDEEGVQDGWLFISASPKRNTLGEKTPTKEKKRIPVGDKGLGRLATMRLGEVLRLKTMIEAERQTRTVSFAWSSFKSGEALEEVEVKSAVDQKLQGRRRGTNVEILGLREPEYWSADTSVNAMLSKLSTLISPFRRFNDFQVNIRASGQEHDLQAVSAEALNFASAKFVFSYEREALRLKAYVAKSLFRGQAGEANRRLFDEFFSDKNLPQLMKFFGKHSRVAPKNFCDLRDDPGGWLFSLEDEIAWSDIPRDTKLQGAVDPGPFSGEIYNFLFNDQTKEQLVAANVPLALLQGMTTIGMFRDGFRVRMSDDWLELAKGVTSGGFFQLRPRNVIGYFAISNKCNPKLVEKSDREGFVDNESWRGFLTLANRTKKFANDTLDAVRTAYDEFKKKEISGSPKGSLPAIEDREIHIAEQKEKAQQSLQTLLERSDDLAERVSETKRRVANLRVGSQAATIVKQLTEIEDGIQDVRSKVEVADLATRSGFLVAGDLALSHGQLEERNLRLLDAAAVGLSARSLVHEINTHLQQLGRAITAIAAANKEEPNERISRAISGITDVVRELKKVVATIDPLSPGSRTLKDDLDVYAFVKSFAAQRSSRLDAAGVEFQLSGAPGLQIRFSRARFTQILENMLQNSLYWIDEHAKDVGDVVRQIVVDVDQTGLSWKDGAKGVRPALEESLFDAYVTDKPINKGQGLGLFIVSSFLQAERCSIGLLQERNRFRRRYIFRVDLSGARRR